MANAVAQADAVLLGVQADDNVLDGARHPGGNTELSVEDKGRQAEVRNLDRTRRETARVRVIRRRRVANEMKALVEHLGMHPDDADGAHRRAVAEVTDTVDKYVKTKSKRPGWTKPPDGYPTWKVFLVYHLPGEVMVGSSAGGVLIYNDVANVGWGLIAATAVSGVTGTLIKNWYGKNDKKNTDDGHGYAGKVRDYETALRRKQLLDPVIAKLRGDNSQTPVPAEPKPEGDWPATHQPLKNRIIARGGPVLGAATAWAATAFGFPVWSAVGQTGIALVNAVGGPIAEKFFRNKLIPWEWHKLDDIGRRNDEEAAKFDEYFAKQLSLMADRINNIARIVTAGLDPAMDPVARTDSDGVGLHLHHGNNVGQTGTAANNGADAIGKWQGGNQPADGTPVKFNPAVDAALTGGIRSAISLVLNAFIDRQFLNDEYEKIFEQVRHDFRKKMVDKVELEHKVLDTLLADLNTKIKEAESAAFRVNKRVRRRAKDLRKQSGELDTQRPDKPAAPDGERPPGHQDLAAFRRMTIKQGGVIAFGMGVAAYLIPQTGVTWGVIGTVSVVAGFKFYFNYNWRHNEQLAVDDNVLYDRKKEKIVEKAEAKAREKFLIEFMNNEIERALAGRRNPSRPPTAPALDPFQNRNRDDYPDIIAQNVQYQRDLLLHEPRPWSLLGAKLLGLDRIERLVQRARDFDAHAAATGDTTLKNLAREELHKTWEAFDKLRTDGTAMPDDREMLKPEGMRSSPPSLRPAGELQSYLDNSIPTRGGRAFYVAGDEVLLSEVHDVPPEDGQYTIDMHGSAYEVSIGEDLLTPDDLAWLIEHDPNWQGQPIRLLACETGRDANGFAQQLADRLGVRVYAPTHLVGMDEDGEMYVTETFVNAAGLVKLVKPAVGRMVAFDPTVRLEAPAPPAPAPPPPAPPPSQAPPRAPPPAGPLPSTIRHGTWWPDQDEVRIDEVPEPKPIPELGELTLMRHGPTVHTTADRLWPDELADLVVEEDGWERGPTRLQVRDGFVDPQFVQRLADLLGVPVVVPAAAVSPAGEFATLSSGTLDVYNEPPASKPPPGCQLYQPRTVMAGEKP